MKVSVIITSYNYEQFIKEAIDSVLAQTFQDFEIIIIDDASSDSSVKIIEQYADEDSRIKVIKNPVNKGLAKSLKTACSAARGEYIAFLESDDKWTKGYLERKLKIFSENDDVGFVYNAVRLSGYYSRQKEEKYNKILNWSFEEEYPKDMFFDFGYQNRILTLSSFMFRGYLLEKIDFNTPVDKEIDWYFYVQIAKLSKAFYIPKQLTVWRLHKDSYINIKKDKPFKFANISAYMKFLKKDILNYKLLIYIIFSIFIMVFKKLINEYSSKY